MRTCALLLAATTAMLLLGCGGRGGGSSTSRGDGDTQQFGTLAVTGWVTGQPVTANSTDAKFVGLVGSFSRIDVHDPSPSVDETVLAVATGNTSIYTVSPDGANEHLVVTDANGYPDSLAFSKDGKRIYYAANAFARWVPTLGGNYNDLFGSYRTVSLDLSPDGTKMARIDLVDGVYDIYISKLDGTQRVRVTNTAAMEDNVTWVKPTVLAYDDGNAIRTVWTDGTHDAPLNSLGGKQTKPRGSPDGNWIGFLYRTGDGTRFNVAMSYVSIWGTGLTPKIADLGENATCLAWAPDSGNLAAGTASKKIMRFNVDGSLLWTVQFTGDNSSLADLAWSPFITDRTLVGTGGSLASTCAGFVFSQSGVETKAVAAFSATTPSTAKIASDDQNTTGPNVVYTAEMDKLTKVDYTIDNQYRVEHVTPSAGANGLLLSFDSTTGLVTSAITYKVTRSSGAIYRRVGDSVVVEGDLLNVIGADGRDLGSASRVTIDETGSLRLG